MIAQQFAASTCIQRKLVTIGSASEGAAGHAKELSDAPLRQVTTCPCEEAAAHLEVLRDETEVEELKWDPQLPVGYHRVLPVPLHFALDLPCLALCAARREMSIPGGCAFVKPSVPTNNHSEEC